MSWTIISRFRVNWGRQSGRKRVFHAAILAAILKKRKNGITLQPFARISRVICQTDRVAEPHNMGRSKVDQGAGKWTEVQLHVFAALWCCECREHNQIRQVCEYVDRGAHNWAKVQVLVSELSDRPVGRASCDAGAANRPAATPNTAVWRSFEVRSVTTTYSYFCMHCCTEVFLYFWETGYRLLVAIWRPCSANSANSFGTRVGGIGPPR